MTKKILFFIITFLLFNASVYADKTCSYSLRNPGSQNITYIIEFDDEMNARQVVKETSRPTGSDDSITQTDVTGQFDVQLERCPSYVSISGSTIKEDSNGNYAITTYNGTNTSPGVTQDSSDNFYCVAFGTDVQFDRQLARIVHYVIVIMQLLVPILLVIYGMVDLARGMASQKEDEIKKGQQIFIKRLIAGVMVFLVVAVVKFVISLLSSDTGNIMSCVNCFISEPDGYKC